MLSAAESRALLIEAPASGRFLRPIFFDLFGGVYDHLSFVTLEARQAGRTPVENIKMGLIMTCLVLSAWLAVMGGVVVVLVHHSPLTFSNALMLILAVHFVLAMLLVSTIFDRSRRVLVSASSSRIQPVMHPDREIQRSR